MKDGGKISIELYPETAPQTVANFVSLVQQGFYNGLLFHRVIPGFMIQGGCPRGDGTGGPGYSIKGEFSSNRFKNELHHERGVVSMARSSFPDSAGSQFFIMVASATHLDGEYAAFGRVVEGLEVADVIVSTPRDFRDRPHTEQYIDTVTVDTRGWEFPEVNKLKG
ncbi:MAG TPA: peptidylprolyl isomerase [Syntrophomonadaceae bacterium]|nr:peptidylprolyl isomerase [Syntrophomonadaceae bacterium]